MGNEICSSSLNISREESRSAAATLLEIEIRVEKKRMITRVEDETKQTGVQPADSNNAATEVVPAGDFADLSCSEVVESILQVQQMEHVSVIPMNPDQKCVGGKVVAVAVAVVVAAAVPEQALAPVHFDWHLGECLMMLEEGGDTRL